MSTTTATEPTTAVNIDEMSLLFGVTEDTVRAIVEHVVEILDRQGEPDELPSTGDAYLDEALDALDPVAQTAVVALLGLHGKDDRINLARDRLNAHVARFEDPEALRELCIEADSAEAEESCRYWFAFGSSPI